MKNLMGSGKRVVSILGGRRNGLVAFSLAGVIWLMSVAASAQVLYGTITGTVTDPSGAVIPKATVKLRNQATGVETVIASNSDGLYSASTLLPGVYSVEVSAPGFSIASTTNVEVTTNATRRVDEKLRLGASEQVVVTDTPPALETQRADVNYELSTEQIEELPTTSTTGRNLQSLYQLVPGATPPAEQNSAAGNPQRSQAVNFNGAPNIANSTHLDGSLNESPGAPYLIPYVPSQDAVQSVNFATNSYTAEQGLAGGAAVNIVVKSGTNKFHGSLFEYNQSTPYNAKPWLYSAASVPKNMFNEFGGSIGGPVLKDKLFFFFDLDRFTQRKTLSNYWTIPDKNSPLAQGDFSGTGTTIYDPSTGAANGTGRVPFSGNKIPVSPVAQKLIALLPNPTVNLPSGNFFSVTNFAFDRYNADAKINYVPTNKLSMFGRYSWTPDTITDPQSLGAAGGYPNDYGQPGNITGRTQNVGVGVAYALRPSFVVDANAGYTRFVIRSVAADAGTNYGLDVLKIPGTNNPTDSGYSGIPAFVFSVGYAALGNVTVASPSFSRANIYSGNANATYTHGLHAIRFGFEYWRAATNDFQPQGTLGDRGGFVFSGAVTALNGGKAPTMYNSLADFMLGLPQQIAKATQLQNPNALRYWNYSGYVQDTFQISKVLTLNYGMRYEVYPFAVRDHFGASRYDPVTGNVLIGGEGGVPRNTGENIGWGMLVPRVGVNYHTAQKTVIRAGFGMTVEPDNFRFLRDAYPSVVLQSFNGVNSYLPAGCLNSDSYTPLGGCAALPSGTYGIPAPVFPDITRGQFPLPAAVTTNTVPQHFRRGYLYSDNLTLEQEFPHKFIGTVAYLGTREVRAVSPLNINAAPVGTGAAGRPLNILHGQSADIFSMQPMGDLKYNGLQTQLRYRGRRAAQFGIVYTWSKVTDFSDNSTFGTVLFADAAYYHRNYAVAGYDRPNNLQIWTLLNAPQPGRTGFIRNRILSAIVGGWTLTNITSKVSGTPMTIQASATSLNAPGSTQVADQVKDHPVIYGAHSPNHLYFDPTAYAPVTAARYGTSARNGIRGPGFFRLDVSLSRSFKFADRYNFRFGVDSFDVTNTPAFNNPGTNASSAALGYISSAAFNRTVRVSGRLEF